MQRPTCWIVLGLALLLFVAATAQQSSAEPLALDQAKTDDAKVKQNPEVVKAFELFRNQKFTDAYETLKKACEKDSTLPPPEMVMGQFLIMAQKMDAARSWIEQGAKNWPEDPEAYLVLGQLALQEGRMVEADLLLQKASELIEKFDKNADRKTNLQSSADGQLARLAMTQGNWEVARLYLESILAAHPDDIKAIRNYAQTLFEEDKIDQALAKLGEAKKINEQMLSPEIIIGNWLIEKGKNEESKKYMIAAVNKAPEDLTTRLAVANWAFQIREIDEADKQAQAALKLDPKSRYGKLIAGNVALFKGEYPSAVKYFKEVLAESPNNFSASNNLALALAEQDDRRKQESALQYARMNAKMNPKGVEAFSTLGRVLFRLGLVKEAEQALRTAAKNGNIPPDSAFYLAEIFVENGNKDDAIKLLEDALKSKLLFSRHADAEALLKKLNQK
jgi:tetratricopeptide (TPR) repeat protein